MSLDYRFFVSNWFTFGPLDQVLGRGDLLPGPTAVNLAKQENSFINQGIIWQFSLDIRNFSFNRDAFKIKKR